MKRRSKNIFSKYHVSLLLLLLLLRKKKKTKRNEKTTFSLLLDCVFFSFGYRTLFFTFLFKVQNSSFFFVLSILIYKIYFFPLFILLQLWTKSTKSKKKVELNWKREWRKKNWNAPPSSVHKKYLMEDISLLFFVAVVFSAANFFHLILNAIQQTKGPLIDVFKWPFHLCLLSRVYTIYIKQIFVCLYFCYRCFCCVSENAIFHFFLCRL